MEQEEKGFEPVTGEEVVIGTEMAFLSESMTAYMHGAGIIPSNFSFVALEVVDHDGKYYYTKGEFVKQGEVQ